MKVVCIKKGSGWGEELVIGETYEVLETVKNKSTGFFCSDVIDDGTLFYKIKTRNGSISWLLSTNFKTLDEIRDDKIDEIIL